MNSLDTFRDPTGGRELDVFALSDCLVSFAVNNLRTGEESIRLGCAIDREQAKQIAEFLLKWIES